MSTSARNNPDEERPKKLRVRTHTPRPDQLTRETFEFITAIDEYKRRNMRSFLTDGEVLEIVYDLGYRLPGRSGLRRKPKADQIAGYLAARKRYRIEKGRLFPTWSEVFALLCELGYRRGEESDAA
jgi:hypothetical protein